MKKYLHMLIVLGVVVGSCLAVSVLQNGSAFHLLRAQPDVIFETNPPKPQPAVETIMLEGDVYPRTFKEFYDLTDTGMDHYHIILDTNGGAAPATVGIMNRILELQQRGVYFTTEVYSKAFSAGAFIWMMGDSRIMHTGSQLMFHTMIGQKYRGENEIPQSLGLDVTEFFYNYDVWVTRMTERQFPDVLPITLETILWQSGTTYINAEQAKELNMLTEYVDN